jgi:hypothetical protein
MSGLDIFEFIYTGSVPENMVTKLMCTRVSLASAGAKRIDQDNRLRSPAIHPLHTGDVAEPYFDPKRFDEIKDAQGFP